MLVIQTLKGTKEEECAGTVLSYIHSPCPQGRVVAFLHVFKDLVPTLVLALRLETTELLRKKKITGLKICNSSKNLQQA